jgi:hypothetical protein
MPVPHIHTIPEYKAAILTCAQVGQDKVDECKSVNRVRQTRLMLIVCIIAKERRAHGRAKHRHHFDAQQQRAGVHSHLHLHTHPVSMYGMHAQGQTVKNTYVALAIRRDGKMPTHSCMVTTAMCNTATAKIVFIKYTIQSISVVDVL